MKRVKRVKGLALLVSLVVILIFLTGCHICIDFVCPPYQETAHPQILGTIYFCDLLEYMRGWAPWAMEREPTLLYSDLVSKADIQWVLNKVGWNHSYSTLINLIHNQPGYENIPFGYVKYYWGQYSNVVVVMENGKIKAFIVASGKLIQPVGGLIELIRDYNIIEIVI